MKEKSKNTAKAVGAVVLAAAMLVGGAVAGWYANEGNWFGTRSISADENAGTNGMTVTDVQASGLSVEVTPLASTTVGDGQVMTNEAYTITVTPTPEDAVDTYAWASSNNSAVSLDVFPNTKSCTVTCNAAFSEQITITITSNENADIAAYCTLDYVKPLLGATVSSPTTIAWNTSGAEYTVSVTPNWGTGTITPDTLTVTGGTLTNDLTGLATSVSNTTIEGRWVRRATTCDLTFSGNSFSVTTPYDAFVSGSTVVQGAGGVSYHTDNNSGNGSMPVALGKAVAPLAFQIGAPTESQLKTAYNNSVKTQSSGSGDGTLTVNFSYSHLGVSLGSSTASTSVEFDMTSAVTYAYELNTNQDGIIFYT